MGIFVEKNGKAALFCAAFAVALFLSFKYLLPLVSPFVPAFLLVYLTYPGLMRLSGRLRIRRELLLAFFLAIVAALACLGVWALLKWGADWIPGLYRNLELIERQLVLWLRGGCGFLEKNFGIDAKEAEQIIVERLEVFAKQIQVNLWPTAAKQSFTYIKKFGKIFAFGGITVIAALLLCRDYEQIVKKMNSHPTLAYGWQFVQKAVKMVGGYVKAQAVIICAIAAIAVTGLWIGRVEGAVIWGLLAGLLDALPFIGTGVVLLPLALWQLLNGKLGSMAAVLICFVLCIMARELLEPRLLGRQLGVSPVIMLFSVYAGMKVFGIIGLFLGPLYVMLLQEGCRMYAAAQKTKEKEDEDQTKGE